MSQHFIKIEIKGESNLPQKTGYYTVHDKRVREELTHSVFYVSGNSISKLEWENVDWYLLPVPEPQQPEQPESAETWLKNRSDYDNIEGAVDIQWLINLLTEFSQSHNNTVVGPTEEELMTYFNNHTSNVVNNGYVTLKAMVRSEFLDAIKWFRSQVREVELKGELERIIIDFINGRFKTILFSTASKKEAARLIVDDYLSARKEDENE